MKYRSILWGIVLLSGIATTFIHAQDAGRKPAQTPADSSSKVTPGDTPGQIKYHMKTFPGDTTIDRHMPRYSPGDAQFIPVDSQPVPTREVQPDYPDEARASNIEGTVWIKCLVGKDGKVSKAEVIRPDAEVLNKAAVAAALQWTFTPAKRKGEPVAVWSVLPFRFKLDAGK